MGDQYREDGDISAYVCDGDAIPDSCQCRRRTIKELEMQKEVERLHGVIADQSTQFYSQMATIHEKANYCGKQAQDYRAVLNAQISQQQRGEQILRYSHRHILIITTFLWLSTNRSLKVVP
uniref:Uncharacterized protein n=1 Tax=Spongospora subterranea TaxID=70186 RepID=A0A0H5QLR3_9EUKA|eukprot:CRZ03095.1 hypothetical protein [Spongospora subterranea]